MKLIRFSKFLYILRLPAIYTSTWNSTHAYKQAEGIGREGAETESCNRPILIKTSHDWLVEDIGRNSLERKKYYYTK